MPPHQIRYCTDRTGMGRTRPGKGRFSAKSCKKRRRRRGGTWASLRADATWTLTLSGFLKDIKRWHPVSLDPVVYAQELVNQVKTCISPQTERSRQGTSWPSSPRQFSSGGCSSFPSRPPTRSSKPSSGTARSSPRIPRARTTTSLSEVDSLVWSLPTDFRRIRRVGLPNMESMAMMHRLMMNGSVGSRRRIWLLR